MVGTNKAGRSVGDMLQIPHDRFWDTTVRAAWPLFVTFRETGLWLPGLNIAYWAFDEVLRMGLLWAMNEGPSSQIYIEMPTANRSEGSYSSSGY